jgi:hypothetical protein
MSAFEAFLTSDHAGVNGNLRKETETKHAFSLLQDRAALAPVSER